MLDIYRATMQRGKYPPLSRTLRCITVLVYTTQMEKISLFLSKIGRNEIVDQRLCFAFSEVSNVCYLHPNKPISVREKHYSPV